MTNIPWLPKDTGAQLPWLSVAQMREVDRAMVEDYGIVLLQMMENAGRHLAYLARARFLGGDARWASASRCWREREAMAVGRWCAPDGWRAGERR